MQDDTHKPIKLYTLKQSGLKDVTEESHYSRPTLILLGGSDASDEKSTIGYANYAQIMLGRHNVFNPDIRLAVAAYPHDSHVLENIITRKHNYEAPKGYYDDMAFQFVKRQFLPLIADKVHADDDGNVTGEKLPLEKVKRNFSNIRIMTHSFGGVAGEQIGNALVHCMKKLGFSQQEIDDTTREIMVLDVGSVAYPMANQSLANFTRITLLHAEDMKVEAFNRAIADMIMTVEDYKRTETNAHGQKIIKPLHIIAESSDKTHRVTVFADGIGKPESPDETGYIGVSHKGELVTIEDGAPKLNARTEDSIKHRLDTYLEPKLGKHGMLVPAMMQSALINAFNNSLANQDESRPFVPLPKPRELFRLPEKAAFTQAPTGDRGVWGNPRGMVSGNRYEQRIEAALADDPHETGRPSVWSK